MLSLPFEKFLADESGNNAVEYGLVAGMISIAIVGAVILLGESLKIRYETIVAGFN